MGQAKKRGTREERVAQAENKIVAKMVSEPTMEALLNGTIIEDNDLHDLCKKLGIPAPSEWALPK